MRKIARHDNEDSLLLFLLLGGLRQSELRAPHTHRGAGAATGAVVGNPVGLGVGAGVGFGVECGADGRGVGAWAW